MCIIYIEMTQQEWSLILLLCSKAADDVSKDEVPPGNEKVTEEASKDDLPAGNEDEKKDDNVPRDEETEQEVNEDSIPAVGEQAEGHEEPATPAAVKPSPITWDSLGDKKKFFNFDIMPKVLV